MTMVKDVAQIEREILIGVKLNTTVPYLDGGTCSIETTVFEHSEGLMSRSIITDRNAEGKTKSFYELIETAGTIDEVLETHSEQTKRLIHASFNHTMFS